MPHASPTSAPNEFDSMPQSSDWQSLRGELVALLDQVEGEYAEVGSVDPAYAGFAQRMRDLRVQVADVDPIGRQRQALLSVQRQMDRFSEREETATDGGDGNVLRAAIEQIRARAVPESSPARATAPQAPQPAPHLDDFANTLAGMSERLGQFEQELKARRSDAAPVGEIAEQVSQLTHVMELLAGAVGETGQVKRLESQIAGLAQLINAGPKPDFSQLNERLDAVAATVDRLADLQVQQIQHVVREAEASPRNDAELTISMQAIEASVRNIYDRLDTLEATAAAHPAELDGLSRLMQQLSARLGTESGRPDRLIGLVDALNSRINEIEDKSEAFSSLQGELDALRRAVLTAMEPRFSAIETQIGALDEKLGARPDELPGVARLEAQIRQLVARMDQTGEQLAGLAQLYTSSEGQGTADLDAVASLAAARAVEALDKQQQATTDRPEVAPPDFEALAQLAAAHAVEAMERQQIQPDLESLADMAASRAVAAMARQAPAAPVTDLEALADMVALRTSEVMARRPQASSPDLEALARSAAEQASAAVVRSVPQTAGQNNPTALAELEGRIVKLVDAITHARATDNLSGMHDGIERVEERLKRLETSLGRRDSERAAAVAAIRESGDSVLKPSSAPTAAPAVTSVPPAAKDPDTVVSAAKPEGQQALSAPQVSEPEPKAIIAQPKPATTAPAQAAKAKSDIGTAKAPNADAMPRNPDEDAPLSDFGFPDPGPVRAALAARDMGRKRHPEIGTPPVARADSEIDAWEMSRPPRPVSSFDTAATHPTGDVDGERDATHSSRNTFIEAARRAAQRQSAPHAAADSNSLIGRAMSRFQSGKSTDAEPELPTPAADLAGPPKPAGRGFWRKRPAEVPVEPVAAEPAPFSQTTDPVASEAHLDLAVDEHEFDAEQGEVHESFLSRHRKPILIGASLVAVSFMTLNLVMQRMSATEAAQIADGTATATVTPAAKVAPASAAVAAPSPASNEAAPVATPTGPLSAAAPALPEATETANLGPRIRPNDPVTTGSIPTGGAPLAAATTAEPAPLADSTPPATDTATAPATEIKSPVEVELPPEGVGPLSLRQSAADGDARSQFEIAAIYSEGRAVPQDYKQADIWYERAAAQGFAPAQYRLGNLYETGKGVTKDLEQARLWYQRAAEAGNRMAMHNLAALYAGGQFGKQDFSAAAEWFERAANLDMKDSQFNLGMLYARGLGVPQNLETSYKWFALAATTGDKEAAKARDNMARSLDADAVKKLNAEVAAWKPGSIDLAANFAPLGTWDPHFDAGATITSKDVVSKVQMALARLGFDVGTPDGHVGPKTADAIKAFEHGTGMSEIGAVNPRLLAVLGSQPV